MLIDFHCHTKTTKSGEDERRNISPCDFRDAILNAQVKMVAITNHNEFNKQEFIEYKNSANNEFIVLPGIELDVEGLESERGHIVIVYDDSDIDSFELLINDYLNGKKPDDVILKIDDIIAIANKINCILLAHYIKRDALNINSINMIKEGIKDPYRFFYEPSSYRTLGIMVNNNFRALKGSDVTNWEKYSTEDFANVKLEIDSYKNFMLFIKKDETIIESLLNKQNKYKIDISYDHNEEKVDLFDNINVFFGTKGTGKSVSLEKINTYFLNLGRDVKFYSPDQTSEKIKEKLKISENERKLSYYDMENKQQNFKIVFDWSIQEVTQFIEYLNYFKYKGKNKNKDKMKILNINQSLDYDDNKLKIVRDDYDNLTKINKLFYKINIDNYLENDKRDLLENSLKELFSSIILKYSNEFDDSKGVYFANNCVDQIKKSVEKNTETKTIPTGTGFKEFAKSLFKLENNMKEIIDGFNFEYNDESEYVGTLEENKQLYKKISAYMLSDDSKSEDGFLQISKIKNFRKILYDLEANIYSNNLIEKLNQYKNEYLANKTISLDDFLGVKKTFIMNGKPYIPSTGESTMILLDEILTNNHDVYILDEPEKSLGNNYISDVLVPKLNSLSKLKKVIVIATHNANIAVRTFPYCSVLKTYYNGSYNTYIGNPYSNKLTNILNSNDTKNWKEESISILEGGRDAFYERGDIYE